MRLLVRFLAASILTAPLAACGSATATPSERTATTSAVPSTPPRPLSGTTWVVDTVVDGPSSASLPIGVQAQLRIDGDQLSFDGGCNSGGATVRIEGDVLQVSSLYATAKRCEGPRADVDRLVATVLSASPTFHIDGNRLRLDAGEDRGLGLQAKT